MIVYLETDEEGNLILPLSNEFCEEAGWEIGDTIHWQDNGDGTYTLTKANHMKPETELVLVDCVSTFRMRYVVEVPKGKKDWALDTVTMQEAKELSQEHIGEQIVSHRVITEEEYLQVFDEDNSYLKNWDKSKKLDYITEWEPEVDDVEHNEYYYDLDRNR